MEDSNKLNNTIFLADYKEGAILIFKKWSSFRLALDNSPEIINNYNDDHTDLEINSMLELLFGDVLLETEKDSGTILQQTVADILFSFIQEFFDVDMDDDSDKQVAKLLIKLANELKNNNKEYLVRLRALDKDINYKNYSIEYPIVNKPLEEDFAIKANLTNNIIIDDDGFVEVKKGKKY